MSELAPLIADLALILVCAGIMTVLFKKLGQPLVLGYIVAGFLASPHFGLLPSVVDTANVHIWADIGVIFLLFALGLEFSFKKIVKVGGPAVIAALTIIFGMIFLGITVGKISGWQRMDSIFLGGMIAMSSTTIIYKAFDDLGLRGKKFTGLVLSILILEDILAVVLMVLLSTMAVSNSIEGGQMLGSIAKLVFFLVLWFVVGIYLIPLLLKKARPLMNDETLLVVSLGLCFAMVVIAAKTGFSAAFGAFIMGSILAETVEAEHIDRLVKPVKDLFGAIFFVSVGMMVDPAMIVAHKWPILLITLAVLLGQATFGTLGVLLSGQTLKTAIQCGFSLTQIGEFAFIIAGLGVSLGVTSDFLYPIVVAVSVITIFLTPYMIRLAEPVYNFLDRHMPERWKHFLNRYASGGETAANDTNEWKTYILAILRVTLINSIVAFAIIALSFRFLVPLLRDILPQRWADLLSAVAIVLMAAPFLRSIMIKKTHSPEFRSLWGKNRVNRAPLVASILIRIFVAMGFVVYILSRLLHFSVALLIVLALLLVILMISSRFIKSQSMKIERTFNQNLRSREIQAEYLGQQKPAYASKLISKDLHFADFDIPPETQWAGKTLMELDFGRRFGVHIVSILRGTRRLNIPKATDRIYPQDRVQIIGTDSGIEAFGAEVKGQVIPADPSEIESSEMILRLLRIGEESRFAGLSIKDSGIRNRYHCMIAGVEDADGNLHAPDVSLPLEAGNTLWVVGERHDVEQLLSE